ncbi:hypothetical protein D9758_016973 [Tetrapyrgos nigripes]|uniref:Uncharacterized protein n=1 Tax=Tetrapyrgos nigripes TaxID=182062 RepID=A0A8H5CB65_9AGAR|nr:hypothetical protein D9758_016973 [Tetrapyrgos nigripes]
MQFQASNSSLLIDSDMAILQGWFTEIAVEASLFGIEILLTASTILLLYQQGLRKSPMRSFLVAACAIMCFNSAITVVSNRVFHIVQIQSLANPAYDPTEAMIRAQVLVVVVSRISYFLGDLIVVWRTWILFKGEILPQRILLFCIVQALGCSIFDAFVAIRAFLIEDDSYSPTQEIFPASLIFTTLVATLLIGYKTWQYRQSIKVHLGNLNRKSQVEQILVLLIESGILYCIPWILTLPTGFVSEKYTNSVGEFMDVITPHIEVIYPTTIILLSHLYRTQEDSLLSTISLSAPLEFAAPAPSSQSISLTPVNGTLDGDKESQEVSGGNSAMV